MAKVPDRWIRTKSDEVAVDRGYWFDITAADRVRSFFFRFLRHSKGQQFAGKPFELLDWQWDRIIGPTYGWKRPDGTRRFRKVGLGVAKKNGKSTLLSGIALYQLIGDQEPGAEVYSAAADKDQASIIYDEAANMVEASPALLRLLGQPKRSGKAIRFAGTNSIYRALSADVPTKEGLNAHSVLFDEVHAQRNWLLWDTLKYAGAARRQSLDFWISTAGVSDPTSLWEHLWKIARDLQTGAIVDLHTLGVIYEAKPGAAVDDQQAWRDANPSLGVIIKVEDMADAANEAKHAPKLENAFRRYRLDQATQQATRWIPMDKWAECAVKFTQDNQKRQKAWVGLDLATTIDVAAAVFLFKDGLKYRILPYFWVPREQLKRRRKEGLTPLDYWVETGAITATPGDVIDYQVIRKDLNDLADLFKVIEIGIDPWNATSIATDLEGDNFHVEYVRTGFASISAPTKEFEKLVLGKQLEHNDNPVMNWMMGNVAVEQDASGNYKPSKKRSSEKIDGVVATIIALHRATKDSHKASVYEKRGILSGRRK